MGKKSPEPIDSSDPDTSKNKGIFRKWEVVSTEYSMNEHGNRIVSKETYQLRREFWLKIISSSAVIIAFAGLGLNLWYQRKQNDFQIAQQKSLVQFATYTKCMANLNSIATSQEIDSTFLKSERALEFENYPQIMLLGKDKLASKFDDMISLAYFYMRVHAIRDTIQSVVYLEWHLADRIDTLSRTEYELLKNSRRKFADFNAEISKGRHINQTSYNYLRVALRDADSNKVNAAIKSQPPLKECKSLIKSICDNSFSATADLDFAFYHYLTAKMDYYDTGKGKFLKDQDYFRLKFNPDMVILQTDIEKLNNIQAVCRAELIKNRRSILASMIETNLLLKDN